MNVKSRLLLNLSYKSLWKVYRSIKKKTIAVSHSKEANHSSVSCFYKKLTFFNDQMAILLEKTPFPVFKKS